MTKILVAEHAGACFGVERALRMTEDAARKAKGPVHTLGPLIHNHRVVSELRAQGVTAIEGLDEVEPHATILLRTHGVTPWVETQAKETGAHVIDATCPFIKRVHKAVERLDAAGYQVIVIGEAGHPEVEGTCGHTHTALVIGSATEVAHARLGKRVGLVVQTTLSRRVVREVVDALVGRVDELRLIDTVCEATRDRQLAAAELAEKADVMMVVGGRNSANTCHLAQICEERCASTYHVEHEDELVAEWFAGASCVGITAGASTPAAHIEAIQRRVEELCA
ncbi:MAG: 4-hydroxy-3-methylbut-2-enyl diphosphate reductase [Atopobiaceae bacterium]|nr:4-hydroxy-3-methylbut-2-enyl diphosphate reductase [Atopobiaceae bacterium]